MSGRTLVSRHAARVAQLTHTLVSQLTGAVLKKDTDRFSELYERTLRILEIRQSSSETLETIDVRMQRYDRFSFCPFHETYPHLIFRMARKSRINVQENLAEALIRTWTRLKSIAADDFQDEDEIRVSDRYITEVLLTTP
jgi:hypothetical protein